MEAKKAAGYCAAGLIEEGMTVGIGTGSTVLYFIERLSKRCKEGLKIQAIASSLESERLVKVGNIPLVDLSTYHPIDITVDGADEIDPKKQMIKGGGGALVREKIVASTSREMIVIIDESKWVPALGKRKLPVEITSFYYASTVEKISKLRYSGNLRKNKDGSLFITDNGNVIYDIQFDNYRENPQQEHNALLALPGVVDTGFFIGFAGRVIIGNNQGEVKTIP